MNVVLLTYTYNPTNAVASAAKLCYSNSNVEDLWDNLTPDKASSFVNMLSSMGHESPFEHAYFTFGIEGVSRSLLAQLTRHRIASYSVQSQRYVRNGTLEYITPPAIRDNAEAAQIFRDAMHEDIEHYNALADILLNKYINEYKAEGKEGKEWSRKAEKRAIEDARYVLPNAASTKIIMTMNVRSLNNFFEHRCCNRAQWEIRELAEKMLKLCREVAPDLFVSSGPSCITKPCPEGKMSCGKAAEMRERYKA